MTVEQAKRDLPSVQVKWCGNVYEGRVTGRLNPFATVSICGIAEHNRQFIRPMIGPWQHVSWDTVARCAAAGRPIAFD